MSDPLLRRRSLPPGGEVAMVQMADGAQLRRIEWQRQSPQRGSILFLGGRADFIEKYAESYWYWRDAGYALTTFDWRGQGLSGRFSADPLLGDCHDFGLWQADLAAVIADFKAAQPAPHFAVAHSMGAHLLLHHLHRAPHDFARAVLVAPMVGIAGGTSRLSILRHWVRLARLFGLGERYAPGQRSTVESRRSSARMALLTSDAARFSDEHWWIQQNAALALGGISNNWLDQALLWADRLVDLPSIDTPLLCILAARERLVDNRRTIAAAGRWPAARVEMLPDAAHELLRERDAVRDAVLARIDGFFEGADDA